MNAVATIERTADGIQAARIGQIVYAMLPAGQGYRLGTSFTPRPVNDCLASDFMGSQPIEDDDAFRQKMDELAAEAAERASLGRAKTRFTEATPWGPAQDAERYGDGVTSVSTAGHGGFRLDGERNAQVDERWRDAGGWYEEDCDWAIVAHTFPNLFTARERALADKSLRDWHPHPYQAITGIQLTAEQSYVLAKEDFERASANSLVVISAVNDGNAPGMVLCTATVGGRRGVKGQTYHVPSEEYKTRGCFGFIIDEERHKRVD